MRLYAQGCPLDTFALFFHGTEAALAPSGFVAGIYARNDVENGVHKAPANEVVRGALGFEITLNKAQQAAYIGVQGMAWNLGRIVAVSGVVWFAAGIAFTIPVWVWLGADRGGDLQIDEVLELGSGPAGHEDDLRADLARPREAAAYERRHAARRDADDDVLLAEPQPADAARPFFVVVFDPFLGLEHRVLAAGHDRLDDSR